jgi:hypothetical protein
MERRNFFKNLLGVAVIKGVLPIEPPEVPSFKSSQVLIPSYPGSYSSCYGSSCGWSQADLEKHTRWSNSK